MKKKITFDLRVNSEQQLIDVCVVMTAAANHFLHIPTPDLNDDDPTIVHSSVEKAGPDNLSLSGNLFINKLRTSCG